MAYSTQARVEAIFGTSSVAKWLNVDNASSPVQATLDARMAKALAVAYEDVNSILRRGPYAIPVADQNGATPELVVECEATLAGVWLYKAFGTKDVDPEGRGFHRYSFHETWARQILEDIVAAKRKLDAV